MFHALRDRSLPAAVLAPAQGDHALSRRAALATLGALGAGALSASALAQPATSPATPPAPPTPPPTPGTSSTPATGDLNGAGFYRLLLGGGAGVSGGITITVLCDGSFPMGGADGSAFPLIGGNATRAEVEAAAARVFIPPAKVIGHVHTLLVQTGSTRVLIDTGCGSGMGPGTGRLPAVLARAGITPERIDGVVITHLHPDHIGGLMEAKGPGVFPNARFIIARSEVDFWSGPADLSGSKMAPQMRDLVRQSAKTLLAQLTGTGEGGYAKRLDQVADNDAVLGHDALRIVAAPGHTPGHIALRIGSGVSSLLFVTDLLHHAPIQLQNPAWHVAFDADPALAATTRQRLLAMAASEKTLVCGSHIPFPAIGHLRADGKGFAWVPRVWEW